MMKDILNRTETAMTQEHIFKAAELCLKAQERGCYQWCLGLPAGRMWFL